LSSPFELKIRDTTSGAESWDARFTARVEPKSIKMLKINNLVNNKRAQDAKWKSDRTALVRKKMGDAQN